MTKLSVWRRDQPRDAVLPEQGVATRWFRRGEARHEAFGVRYRGYLAAGLIGPSAWETFSDEYDDRPTTLVAGLYRDRACIGTLRVSVWRPGMTSAALPCERVYPEVSGLKHAALAPIVEISRLAIDPAITNTRKRARYYAALMRSGIMAALASDAAEILVATQAKWRFFYEHVLDFSVIGEPQYYPPGRVPVTLLRRVVDQRMAERMAGNAFFAFEEREVDDMRALIPQLVGRGGLKP